MYDGRQVLAAASAFDTNRRGAFSSPSMESKMMVRLAFPQIEGAQRIGHRMPIISPACLAMCATHNVTTSAQIIVTEEYRKCISTFSFHL